MKNESETECRDVRKEVYIFFVSIKGRKNTEMWRSGKDRMEQEGKQSRFNLI